MSESFGDRDGMIWLDGKFVDWRSTKAHVLSHALHYASSIFEGERAYGGKIFASRAHSERLIRSGAYIDMVVPYSVDEIEQAKREVLRVGGFEDAYIRPICWRGVGVDMGIACRRNPVHLAIAAWKWGSYYGGAKEKGARLSVSEWRRPSPETIPCFSKAAGLYMICTLAKHKAENEGFSDALMLDYRGYIAEATGANIFFVKGGEVHTPLPDCFLDGITRQTIIGLLERQGVRVHERHILPRELEGFEQCWLTGTAAEVTPVAQIGDYNFEVGDFARDVARAYEQLVRA